MENPGIEKFSYTYAAKEREEIQKIRQKYAAPEDKMEQLRKLDAAVSQRACMCSVIVGVVGALLMGLGMCCAMIWQGVWFVPGIMIGLVGMGVLAAAYPIYQKVLKKEREKIAPEILRLTDELMK